MTVHATWLNGEPWLFLPTHADMQRLRLVIDGALQEPVDWTALAAETETGVLSAPVPAQPDVTLHVMHSQNLRALYLVSDDPVNEGRAWLESGGKHEHSATAEMALVSQNGSVDHAGAIDKLRGRGNSTWGGAKRPYQFKLSRKADLLDTGDVREYARRWVLLADSHDPTLLHNRITFDLALELGMTETPHSEHIDLYYDGEYRGTYLLCEKVEVNEGRVDIVDYDKLIERWNAAAGIADPDSLPVAEGTNRYGCTYTYVDGLVDNGDPQSGGYLLDMKQQEQIHDRCWFSLGDCSTIALKSPENATESMMRYISEKLEEARLSLLEPARSGVSGAYEAYFDVESFALIALINEWSYNVDGYRWGSSFFVLDAGQTQFRAGPVWDFDLAYRYHREELNTDGKGYKSNQRWLPLFYMNDGFFARITELCTQRLEPLVRDVLLGGQNGRFLRPLTAYAAQIDASRRMNERLFPAPLRDSILRYGEDYAQEQALLRQFIDQRTAWMASLSTQRTRALSQADVTMYAVYTQVKSSQTTVSDPDQVLVVGYQSTQLTQPDEDSYARWRGQVLLQPAPGWYFTQDTRATLNDEPMTLHVLNDTLARIDFCFEDTSYRPVDHYGDDLGLVYDYETYLQNHPEVAQEVGDDPEDVLEYFAYEGMFLGHKGNAFFDPKEIARRKPEVADQLGEDWPMYYDEFINSEEALQWWMSDLRKHFLPPVTDLPAEEEMEDVSLF